MKKAILAILAILAMVISSAVSIQAMAETRSIESNELAHQSFKPNSEEEQKNWYRSLRVEDWVQLGAEETDLIKTMNRIVPHGDSDLKDQYNEDKSGYWTYEFSITADKVANLAHDAKQFQRASALCLVAS
ncbi:alpha/beta hydrolase [Photobacterium sagamiensis]|uniref:alpha/beta hydrolase n=1 Tax=Photobacterium sagamiensis TaxID=2910241 RepID=UPI003D124209